MFADYIKRSMVTSRCLGLGFSILRVLSEVGFIGSTADPSMFICHSSSGTIVHLLYVDGIIVTESSSSLLEAFIGTLQRESAMKA